MADIVSYSGIGLYPPFVAGIINAAWNEGLSKSNALSNKIAEISVDWLGTQAAPSISAGTVAATGLTPAELTAPTAVEAGAVDAPAAVGVVDAQTILEPAVTIQASQSAGDVIDLFDSKYLELVALLSDKFTAFRTTYFPDEATAYNAAEVVAKTQQFNVTKALQEEELAAKVGQFNVSTELDAGFKNAELTTKVQQFNVTSGLQGAELVSKVGQFNVSSALTAAEKNQSAEMTLIEDRLKALLTECQAIAQMATSLFNNVHASASVSASDSVSTSV